MEKHMSEQSTESTAAAKGVAVVEQYKRFWVVRVGDYQWFATSSSEFAGSAYDAAWFNSRDIAEAVAAAINARNAKPSLADRIADADTARDAKVAARLAADMDIDTERAQAIADAFRPFVDLQLKLALKKHRDELDERLNGMENDARESRQLVAGQINSINRRIDRLKVIDPGHH